ncbi:methyltransferase domain-containing protein [Amycolatopsis sp., V23-08]|uniref:Methyltransferase domain-containing protein n=1 Tax=Amycolatopsis heterodermiae TaxID=3110235 RepID=A0ABU5QXE4_9PSEU|nr:methyltransferase domain-containing protein [Amycolatopsis sp., V23-08]MEA5358606.1 methyltransferase domain-containing protein [Amycolatopsis sp., V23-08]
MTDDLFLNPTRATYATVAESYNDFVPPIRDDIEDRALLTAFADLVRDGPVADLGCGTGLVTAFLASLGLDVAGIDLTPEMLAVARRNHPELRFSEGSLLALDLPDGGLAGAVAWYSIIHTPPSSLPVVAAELFRVLRPGGHLQLGFHVGDRRHHRSDGYGHEGFSLDIYWLPVDRVADLMSDAGFEILTKVLRNPGARVPQGRVLARKPE